MAKIIKCDTCGSFVLPLVKGDGESCDSHMILMEAQTEGDKAAKHKPVVEIDGDNVTVKIGEIQHPADEDHFIQFVIVEAGSELFIKCFKPGETPEEIGPPDTWPSARRTSWRTRAACRRTSRTRPSHDRRRPRMLA